MDGHSSGTSVAGRLVQPTRIAAQKPACPAPAEASTRRAIPIRFCSRWGLPCHGRYRPRGALLPHPFTLTDPTALIRGNGGLLSVALSLGSPPPGVTRHRVYVEPGLSSPKPDKPIAERPPSHLTPLFRMPQWEFRQRRVFPQKRAIVIVRTYQEHNFAAIEPYPWVATALG